MPYRVSRPGSGRGTVTWSFGLLWLLCVAAFAQQPELGSAAAGREPARRARSRSFASGRTVATAGARAAAALNMARQQHAALLARPRSTSLSAQWTAVGPVAVTSKTYGAVSGRISSLVLDPADASGNTLYVGTTGGGVWKSVHAASSAGAAQFVPLTDTLSVFNSTSVLTPSLSIGALAMQNGVLLAGTGDANDASDSYYGAGILRSADGGATWTLAQQSLDGATGNHSFFGLGTAALAFSTANPALVVAAMSQAAEGSLVNAESTANTQMGLYYSTDAGLTWHMGTLLDGSQTVQSPQNAGTNGGGNAVTSVVWNPVRGSFYAAVRYHGYYTSTDGVTWTRLAHQPGTGLTTAACPTNPGASGNPACPIFRGALAVQAVSGDMFALTVDGANRDQGLFQDACALTGRTCGNNAVTFSNALNAAPLEAGSGSTVIAEADYNLALAAAASGTDTILYVGATDLFRCSLAAGCTLRNTTNAQNGCTNPAMVAPAQHALATLTTGGVPLLFVGNDGGLWRSLDGVNETATPCSLDDATHFQNLNGGLGSLAEVVSFAQSPSDAGTLLAGLGALGTAATSSVTNSWTQLSAGEGGTVAIDPNDPSLWYLSTGAGVAIARCSKGSTCVAADVASPVIANAQVSGDAAAVHAPWLLDPGLTSNLIAGTCRVWRGDALGGNLWSSSNVLSKPFGAAAATACGSNSAVVRSLAAGGPVASSASAQNTGSEVLYAGMAGTLDGGQGVGGHVFTTAAANGASGAAAWTDAAAAPVTNDLADGGVFNPGSFDVSSVLADPHDASGRTVYATVMGFTNNGVNAPHVYRSVDGGAHWTNVSANLPNAPANSLAVDPNDANTVYVALDTGVYATTQVASCASTDCWSVYGTALPNAPVTELLAAASMPTGDGRTGELRAATYGRGIWEIPLLTATAPLVPAMSLAPATVTYSAQQVGTQSAYVAVTVTNTGSADLHVSSVNIAGDFNQTNTCVGASVAAGASCAVQVAFLPTASGTRAGLLTIYGDVAGGQATAALSGVATAAASIVLTPVTLSFPSTGVGATSSVQNVTVANTGGNSATLQTPVVSGDFALQANTCGASLGAGTSCTLSIVFAPAASGPRSGTLTMSDSVGVQVAALSGVGTSPATDTLGPAALTFSPQQLNTTSAGQQVVLTNAGDTPLTLITAQITSGDFAVVNGCGASLIAHATCAMTVTYTPKAVGAGSGTLIVTDQFRSQAISLSGVGLAPPGVSVSPVNGLSFGAEGVGLSSAAQTVTLTNNGGVPLSISGINVTGDFAQLAGASTCGASLSPAAVCTLQVVFTPAAAGLRTGSVTFSDNAVNSPQTMQLSGTGVDFTLASNGSSTVSLPSGMTATFPLLLSSAAGLPGSATFTCAGVPAHALCTVNPASASLGGSTTVSVTVATGLASAALDPPRMPWSRSMILFAALLPVGLMCCRRRLHGALALTVLVVAGGCSTPRSVPSDIGSPVTLSTPTPSGTYTLIVAGSSAGIVRSVNLTLLVQ